MWSDHRFEIGRGSSIDRLVGQYKHLESDASYYREPMEVTEKGLTEQYPTWHRSYVINGLRIKGLDGLQPFIKNN